MAAKHPLFTVTHWLLLAASWLAIGVTLLLALALGGLAVAAIIPAHLGVPAVLGGIDRNMVLALAAFAVLCGLACAVVVFLAIRLTIGIVETAMSGDPFVNRNADRLIRIGWLLLGLDVIGLMAMGALNWLTPEKLQGQIHAGFEPSPVSLFAILLIFVLAQIFRRGSEMRAELEATV